MIVNKLVDSGTLLPTASANATGLSMKFVKYDEITFHVIADTTPSMTVTIQRSVDGTNWVDVGSAVSVSATGTDELLVKGEVALYYRAVVSSYVSGNVEVIFNAA